MESETRRDVPYRFSIRDILGVTLLTALLARFWPHDFFSDLVLVVWTALIIAQLFCWRAARSELKVASLEESIYDMQNRRQSYGIAVMGLLGPFITWLLVMSFSIASRFVDDPWASPATFVFCLLSFLNWITVPALLLSFLMYFRPRVSIALFLMRLLGIVNAVVAIWIIQFD